MQLLQYSAGDQSERKDRKQNYSSRAVASPSPCLLALTTFPFARMLQPTIHGDGGTSSCPNLEDGDGDVNSDYEKSEEMATADSEVSEIISIMK